MERLGHPLLVILLLAAMGTGLRVFVARASAPSRLLGDEWYYTRTAEQIALGHGHRGSALPSASVALRPPAQAWALSLLIDPERPRSEGSLASMRRLGLGLGALLVVLTALLGRALFDARSGLVAGAVAAVYPTFVFMGHYLWSENLFAVLVTAGLLLVVGVERRPHPALVVATGLVFGAAALTRELALGVAGLCGLWWIARAPGRRMGAGLRGALMLACAVAVVLPWTLRNHARLGAWVPVSTVGWFALAEGNAIADDDPLSPLGAERRRLRTRYAATSGELAQARVARAFALERIAATQPGWILWKAVRTAGLLYGPDSEVIEKLRQHKHPGLSCAAARATIVVSAIAYTGVLVAAMLGIAAAGRGPRLLAILLLGGVTALHLVANATPRFRVPWMPLLIVYASFAAVHRRELPARIGTAARAVVATLMLVFLSVSVPYVARYHRPAAAWNGNCGGDDPGPGAIPSQEPPG